MGKDKVLIAPSLLSADFSRLREDIARVEGGGSDWLHVDVMDGHFVPNLTLGPFIVKAIHRAATTPLDVHLMIDDPATYAEEFAEAGASIICYHVECREGGPQTAEKIRSLGVRPGIAVRPDTPIRAIEEHLPLVEMVLVMSVMPGFSGQSFMPEVLLKVRALREEYGFTKDVQMDGGVSAATIADCSAAGANVFVAGSAIFKADDPVKAIQELRALAEGARPDCR
ncbi:ribulose-phosphate 3-epimerase [bacterium]|nr:MAG: ribulose-phosphate 3-epimerase [bacterium]